MKKFLLFIFLISYQAYPQELLISDPVSFLALGDSYTIGQSVAQEERWPEQLADRLRSEGLEAEVEIIARTGWTTRDLISRLNNEPPQQTFYNLVSLLIGVNNQFQGRSQEEYRSEFEQLLIIAINLARGETENVMVLSIPDYAFTPFGQNYSNISNEIDQFNAINKSITDTYQVPYIEITDITRRGIIEPGLVASDGLHPSGIMYSEWVDRIMDRAILNPLVTAVNPSEDSQSKIFPNPAKTRLNIPVEEEAQVTIYTCEGVVFKKFISKQSSPLDLADLPSGTYFIEWIERSRKRVEKFVKI